MTSVLQPRHRLLPSQWAAAAQIVIGVQTLFLQMSGDVVQGLDRNYGIVPDLRWPPLFTTMAANVMLPLVYPLFTPEVNPSFAQHSTATVAHVCVCSPCPLCIFQHAALPVDSVPPGACRGPSMSPNIRMPSPMRVPVHIVKRVCRPCLRAAPVLTFDDAAQFMIAGGGDDSGNGLAYSTRITNIGVGLQPTLVQESTGQARIEGCATNLPDGTVFLGNGAANGEQADVLLVMHQLELACRGVMSMVAVISRIIPHGSASRNSRGQCFALLRADTRSLVGMQVTLVAHSTQATHSPILSKRLRSTHPQQL